MKSIRENSALRRIARATFVTALAFAVVGAPSVLAKEKKPQQPAPSKPDQPKNILEGLDLSKIVWPNPPAITRIRYVNYWSGEKFVAKKDAGQQKKQSWMERVSGVATGNNDNSPDKPRWQLVVPNGVAVDSKKRIYIADSKVRAVFIVNAETGEFEMIRNGYEGRFQWPVGLAIDDTDRLFVSDSGMKRVLVFGPNHKVESQITGGLVSPGGMAVDNENRLLYVADAERDQVMVYDADPPHKLIREMGAPNTQHKSKKPGDFAKPTDLALDQDQNLYVSDTWNNRIEVFDPDGNFIRAFGKSGDGPGYFARPKGIAIDSDGHVWVADAMQNRLQVFTPEGRLLIYMGGPGLYPGQFTALTAVTIDKDNRVITTEQLPGRSQIFRYITDPEARAELKRRNEEAKKTVEERRAAKSAGTADATKTAEKADPPKPETPAAPK